MADPEEHEDRDDDPLDDALDQALDGGFAAARKSGGPEPGRSALNEIQARTGQRPSISLREIDPAGQAPMLKPLVAGDGIARETGKYAVHGILGQGGVGAVHKGHDTELGRDVALKFLHGKYRDQPDVLRRFVEEAQIGGQLQHPGIVPVYELGMADGRPFFAMKMVKGQTLARKLAERASPADDRRTLLSIFEDVCQTMAYAHARGVVHRDLKPANVMVGSFGEVQVVDWGMGKVLQQGGVADEKLAAERQSQLSVIETVRSGGHGTQSVMGSVMGTPAYMPPEQARGDIEAMDARSDVFALGAILCEILTRQPPYVGEQSELISLAALGKLDDAHDRLKGCGADEDLVELTMKCLMPAPAARPQSAQAVAKAVHEHLAVAEQRAHDATVRSLALKRTQKLGIALTVVIAVGLAASLWFWRDADTQRGIAEKAAKDATAAQAIAETNLANFNRLSYVVRLETAKSKEESLYPAWPDKAQAMRDWLDGDAPALQEALPELRETLIELQGRARPQTDEEKAEERRSHPRAAELAALETRLLFLRKVQAVRSGTAKHEPFALDESKQPKNSRELNELAWPLVDPGRKAFGREAEGLTLARRAVSLAPAVGDERAIVTDTLAWALFANGLDDEAVEQSQEALAVVGEAKRSEYQGYLTRLRAAVETARGPEDPAAIDELAAQVAVLQAEVAERRTWTIADVADQFLHHALKALVADIEAFGKAEVAAVGERLAWAEQVGELTITRHKKRWDEARLAILKADGVTASKLYGASPLELKPQTGLVPIGMNARSKLWEFHHLRSAWDPDKQPDPAAIEIPAHDENGRLDMDGRGIVFVLIPGGKFFMGAQNGDESGPNFDAGALPAEGPVREVELAPYFLARHELTQGQWARLTGGDYPSSAKLGEHYAAPVPVGDSHPVEQVSFSMCAELLTRHGLMLPTEAQWENGCRGGTSMPWFTGKEPASLEGFANILDRTGQNMPPEWGGGEAFDDRFKGTAPVGTYDPNPFGLFDVHGNVFEWCRDRAGSYFLATRAGDGLRQAPPSSGGYRLNRGGSYRNAARPSRAALRNHYAPAYRSQSLGVRPARALDP